jgi:hypothetical protein
MPTLEQLRSERDKILAQLSSPTRIELNNIGSTEYRPAADLQAALATIDREIARAENADGRVFTIETKRGL